MRGAYVDPRHWRLFDDAVPALRRLSWLGWTHLVLSNHVPELREILHALGLEGSFLRVFNSADSGYEKPHPRAFDGVLEAVAGAEAAWMIGDNPDADVRGAEAVGLCPRSWSAAQSAARDTTAETSTEYPASSRVHGHEIARPRQIPTHAGVVSVRRLLMPEARSLQPGP